MTIQAHPKLFSTERRPLVGYESYYGITRLGKVYSERLRRFIKAEGCSDYRGRKVIQFQLHGIPHRVGIYKGVAMSWLSCETRNRAREQLAGLEGAQRMDAAIALEREHQITRYAFLYLAHTPLESSAAGRNR